LRAGGDLREVSPLEEGYTKMKHKSPDSEVRRWAFLDNTSQHLTLNYREMMEIGKPNAKHILRPKKDCRLE
jgi:hypothetical protein